MTKEVCPIIVIEGPDGGGKTTLADRCLTELKAAGFPGATLVHLGPPSFDPESELSFGSQAMQQVMQALTSNLTDGVIMDRGYWGEAVYGPIFRPERIVDPRFGALDEDSFAFMDNIFRLLGAVQVLVTNDLDVLMSRLDERGDEDFLSPERKKRRDQLIQVLLGYERIKEFYAARDLEILEISLDKKLDTSTQAKRIIKQAILQAKED